MIGLGFSLTDRNKISAAAVTPWYLSGGVDHSNCIAAYQAKGASSYATSKVNLANPGTFDAQSVVGKSEPSWSSDNGWVFDGSTTLLNTGVTTADIGRGTGSCILRVTNSGFVSGKSFLGTEINDDDYNIIAIINLYYDSDQKLNLDYHDGTPDMAVPQTSAINSGVICFVKGIKLYIDGLIANTSPPHTAWDTDYDTPPIYVGGALIVYPGPSYDYYFGEFNCQAIAFYDIELTDEQVLAITTAMQAL